MITYPTIESERDPAAASYRAVVAAGEPWIRELREGEVLRIVDLEGNQTADTLLFNAHDYGERYSAQDTIRAQKNIYLTAGARLMSSANNVLLTIIGDTCGRHDTLGGACATETNMVLYSLEKRHMHACRQNFLGAMMEWGHGLDKRDISSNIGFFRNVPISPDGGVALTDGIGDPGRYVELRAEMDVLVLLSNCPQINNASNERNPSPIEIHIWEAHKDRH